MTFQQILTQAVKDLTENGYQSQTQVSDWLSKLRQAAEGDAGKLAELERALRTVLTNAYRRALTPTAVERVHHGISRFTVQRLEPKLRKELEKRIAVSADLIKRNRKAAIEKTLQRFEGWASSIPDGGTKAADKSGVKSNIRKSLAQLSFEERRVHIDQAHKMVASMNSVIAEAGGAIAVIWHSHWRQTNYNYREDHKERDGKYYLLRESWATNAGLVKPGPDGYYDDITKVGEEVFCRCYAQYVYTPRRLPDDMLTEKGRENAKRKRETT